MQRLADKLVSAGWIQRSIISKSESSALPGQVVNLTWTKTGQEHMGCLVGLVSEIENASTPLTEEEWKCLKLIAQKCATQIRSGGNLFIP